MTKPRVTASSRKVDGNDALGIDEDLHSTHHDCFGVRVSSETPRQVAESGDPDLIDPHRLRNVASVLAISELNLGEISSQVMRARESILDKTSVIRELPAAGDQLRESVGNELNVKDLKGRAITSECQRRLCRSSDRRTSW